MGILSNTFRKTATQRLDLMKRSFVVFWNEEHTIGTERWQNSIFKVTLIVLTYFLLDKAIFQLTTLSFSSYYERSIYYEFLKGLTTKIYPLILIVVFLALFKKRLFMKWSDFDQGRSLRNLVFLITGILTWMYATYDYNLYFDQGYYFDRLLLVFSLILVYWRPVFVALFLSLVLPIIGQFEVLQGFSLAAPVLLIRVLIMLLTFYVLKLLGKSLRFTDFAFLTGCLVASHYFISGFGKFNTEWLLNDQIYYLLPATYANGWLTFLDMGSIAAVTAVAGLFNAPLKVFVIVVECGSLFFFFGLKWARLLIFGTILMHMGIFLFSGIFFYTWMLLLGGMLYFVFNKKVLQEEAIFNKKYFLISILLIVGGKFWSNPVRLVWYDSPLNYTYRFQAEMVNGSTVVLSPDFFAPYDYQFTLGNFKYLNTKPLLDITWGATGKSTANYFTSVRSKAEIFEYENSHGTLYQNQESKKKLVAFLRQFVKNGRRSPRENRFWNYFKAPRLLWTYPTKKSIDANDDIKAIKVMEITSYYSNENGYAEIRQREVYSVSID